MSSKQQQLDHRAVIDAADETVFDLVADVARWPQFHRSAIHAEPVHSNEKGDLIQYWSLVDDSTARTWRTVRNADRPARRITFTYLDPEPPATQIRGEWVFTASGPDQTLVELRHWITAPDDADVGPLADRLDQDGKEHLETLSATVPRCAELDELVLSFNDPPFVAGSIKGASD